MGKKRLAERPLIGWREWVALPEISIERVKAKIDTGARSSSLHAFNLKIREGAEGKQFVDFHVHPLQRNTQHTVRASAEIIEFRPVKSSTGHVTKRPVILTTVEMMGIRFPIELTLANRDEMGFRMLLGREAVRGKFLIDSGRSYFGGRPTVPKQPRRKK